MPDSYLARPGGQINPQRALSGVRHLTEELIKNTVKDTPLNSITILKLNFSELSGKRIKVIENLEKLHRLHTLNLANNIIERLERLDALTRLKDLDVSHNRIVKIEGLEKLVNLVSLNLEGNQIDAIPSWFSKRLKALRNLRLASNNIMSLQEIRKLRGLPNLTFLTIAHNPCCELPHYRLYIIFHLRTLDVLDGKRITAEERAEAARRFDQEEIEALHLEVNEMQQKFEHLQDNHNRSLQELERSQRSDSQLVKASRESERRIQNLELELSAKKDIIDRKQAELSRANQKHYELEQELAFYKIDTKFTSLHKKPDTPSGADDGEDLMESPYIGKSQHAKDRPEWPPHMRHPANARVHRRRPSDTSPDSLLDAELDHRLKEVEEADRKLALLNDQLRHTEERVATAAEHLVQLSEIANRSAEPLPEDERADLEGKLEIVQQTIDELESNREQLLDNLDKNAADVSEAEQQLDDLDRSLDSSDLEDSEKEALLVEKDDKEAFLAKAKDMRDDLEQALEDLELVLEQKKSEAREINEQLFRPGADTSQPEIGNVAEEVKNILTSLRQGQNSAGDTQALRARLSELEKFASDKDKVCEQLERSLQAEKEANARITEELEHSMHRPDSPTKAQLEEDVRRLEELKDRLEGELEEQQRGHSQDPDLKRQLSKLKRENERLRHDGEMNRSLRDAETMAKLDAMIEKAQSGQPVGGNMADPLERRLAALQKMGEQDRKQVEKEAKKLKEDNSKLQQKIINLSSALAEETRSKDNASSGSESAALIDMLKRELDEIRANMSGEENLKRQLAEATDRLKKAQAELERSKQASRATDQPRLSPSKFNRYSVPPQFDLDAGLDDSYDDSESTRDTVRRMPSSRHPVSSRYDEPERPSPVHGSVSQNSGRVADENPRAAGPPKQNTGRVPPHPDDVMSIASEAPVPYGHPSHPATDRSSSYAAGGKSGRGDRKRGAAKGLGTVPETYESEIENPRLQAPKPNSQARRLQEELARADDEISRLRQALAKRDDALDETLQRTDAAEGVIEQQRDEADRLRQELERYKQEVNRLAALLANQPKLGGMDRTSLTNAQPTAPNGGYPNPPINPAHSQPYTQDYGQLSSSFIQGPSFKPGQPTTSPGVPGVLGAPGVPNASVPGQMFTSTPHRGYPASSNVQHNVVEPMLQHTLPVSQLGQPTSAVMVQNASNPVQTQTVIGAPVYQGATLISTGVTGAPANPATVALVGAAPTTAVTVVSPSKTLLLNTSATATTPVRSILKTSERNGLVCTVPEHHKLEDEHSRLRDKYRVLKSTLKKNSSEWREEKKLSGNIKAATDLKHALKERQGELESLDLAINMQREQLHTLKNSWRNQKERAGHRMEEAEDEERQSELEHYMHTELECLEETLSKRRAELREADKRLVDCRNSLSMVKGEAEEMVSQYENVKDGLENVQTELQVLENHKVERQDEVALLMVETKKLAAEKEELETRMRQIDEVTKERDEHFNSLVQRIQQSDQVLTELQTSIKQQTIDAEQNLHEIKMEAERHLASVRQSESDLSEHYGDIRDIKSVDRRTELSSLSSIEREMKERLEGRKDLLDKVKDKIDDEKETLQMLTIAVEQKEDQLSVLKKSLTAARGESAELLREISERRCLLESLTAETNVVERELGELRAKHSEGRQLLDKLEFETNAASSVLEKLQHEKDSVNRAVRQKTSDMEQQTQKLESNKATLAEMTNTQQQVAAQVREKSAEFEQLQGKMRQLQAEVDDIKFDRANSESQLDTVMQSLKEQKVLAAKLKKVLKEMDSKKRSLSAEVENAEQKSRDMEQQLHQLKYEYQQVNSGLLEAKAELNEQQIATDELRQHACRLSEERAERQRSLKELTTQYERESQQLTDMTERAERELSHMRDQQQVCQTRVAELTRELSRLMSEINKSRKEHGDVTELKAKLQQTETELEGERTTNADLMKRLTEFAQRLQTRNDSLTKVKKQSESHIDSLAGELAQAKKECRTLREKRETDIEDLEWIAQQHAQRADRLNVELEAARQQVETLKRINSALESNVNKDEQFTETIDLLKQDIQQEVTLGMAELEKSRAEAVSELDELRAQKAFIANEVISLKENLSKVQARQLHSARPARSPSPRKSSLNVRRKLDAEQEVVRRKMHDQMQRHLDAMEGMKTHSMGILTDLQDRVSSLQGVLSESTSSIHNTPSPHRPVRDSRHMP
ncbi:centriolin-like [Watersipora subatra]|uniref:centriolin-like n=1 Tax=Watersipora subatra TaxID=2589382 RepID=UPI00355BBA48